MFLSNREIKDPLRLRLETEKRTGVAWGMLCGSLLFATASVVGIALVDTTTQRLVLLGVLAVAAMGIVGGGYLVSSLDHSRSFLCPHPDCNHLIAADLRWVCGFCGRETIGLGKAGLAHFFRCQDKNCRHDAPGCICPFCAEDIRFDRGEETNFAYAAGRPAPARESRGYAKKIEELDWKKQLSKKEIELMEVENAKKVMEERRQPPPPKKKREQELEESWRGQIEDEMGLAEIRHREELRLKRLHPNDPAEVEEGLQKFDHWAETQRRF
jgi:hypothetical protein